MQKYVGEPQFSLQSLTQMGSWSKIRDPQYMHFCFELGVSTVAVVDITETLTVVSYNVYVVGQGPHISIKMV